MSGFRILFVLSVLSSAVIARSRVQLSPPNVLESVYPPWAHSHWVWLDNSVANQKNETRLVLDYLSYNIPVGAVDIDSEWSTGINNFVFDTSKYPNPQQMVDDFHDLGVRVILWATSMVDTDSPNFDEGCSDGYFLNTHRDGSCRTIDWWHGHGSFIDYTCEPALDWWHGQLDNVLKLGIDGWKTDGTDPYIFELPWARSTCNNPTVHVTERDYANDYYGDFFNYTRTYNSESLIMSRPVDSFCNKEQTHCLLYWSFSPHYLMFSGWVGDQDPTFPGMKDALRNMFHSAWRNYTNFGSDIGGYRTNSTFGPNGRSRQLFLRWAQLGAFCSLMENGGGGEHRPWMFQYPNETVAIYRKFVHAHYELGPYLLTAGNLAYSEQVSVMKPIAPPIHLGQPSSWDYMLWKDIFVAPIVENSTSRSVLFPPGNNWVYFFNKSRVYEGGSNVSLEFPFAEFPAFIKAGSLIPLNVSTDLLGHGDARSLEYLTLLITRPIPGQVVQEHSIEWKSPSRTFGYLLSDTMLELSATPHPRRLLWRVEGCPAIARISDANGLHLMQADSLSHFYACKSCWYVNESVLMVKPLPRRENSVLHAELVR